MKQDVRAAKSVARVASGGFTFEMETNSRYTEILELAKRMDKLGIPYELKPCYDGWELLYPNAANVIMDAVSHFLVNDSRNAIEVLGIGEYMPAAYTRFFPPEKLSRNRNITHDYRKKHHTRFGQNCSHTIIVKTLANKTKNSAILEITGFFTGAESGI